MRVTTEGMEMEGFQGQFRVDLVKFRKNHGALLEKITHSQTALNEMAGFPVRVGSSNDLKMLFIDKYKMDPLQMNLKSGRLSFSKDVVRKYETPATPLVMDLKSYHGIEKYFRIAEKAFHSVTPTEARINFDIQEESKTGRVYAQNPSVMSFPADIRECIIPEEGNVFIGADFVAEELTIMAVTVGARKFLDLIKAGTDIMTMLAEKSGVARHDVKTVVYAYMYGAKMDWIGKKLLLSPEQVKAVLAAFYETSPEFSAWHMVRDAVVRFGGSKTLISGRSYSIDTNNPDQEEEIRRAVNFVIQGTAADILRGVIDWVVSKPYFKLKIFVHDSVVVEVDPNILEMASAELKKHMVSYLGNSFAVDLKVGQTWRQAWEKQSPESQESEQ